ncbi:MAG TPA: response regulator [Myxococcaceae bacterium]
MAGPPARKPVLVVDDDRDIREGLQDLLESEGHTVFTASDGQDALEVLATIPRPGLVLLDLMMPRMNGQRFLQHVRGDPALAQLSIVVLTAAPATVQDVAVAGLLRKPPDLDELLRIVGRFCEA